MSPVEIHLALNHVPVVGFAGVFAILAWGMYRKSEEVQRVALIAFVAVAFLTVLVFRSGEPAEKVAKPLPGVTRELIHEHEDAAEYAFAASSICGACALVGLVVWSNPDRRRLALRATLVLSIATAVIIGRTAMLGGRIRHTELRAAPVAAPASAEQHDGRD